LLRVFDVLRDELAVLDPQTLVDELGTIFDAIVAGIAAYDPAAFAKEIGDVFAVIGQSIRALDPHAWLAPADLAFLTTQVERVEGLLPTAALASVGTSLQAAGEILAKVNVADLVGDVEGIRDRVTGEIEDAIGEIADEIAAFLHSLKYVAGAGGGGGGASVSVGSG
jgi:hypothetical protein